MTLEGVGHWIFHFEILFSAVRVFPEAQALALPFAPPDL